MRVHRVAGAQATGFLNPASNSPRPASGSTPYGWTATGGREIADLLARMTGGDPGPVIETASGRRCVYFLVPPGSTTHLAWPPEVTRMTCGPDKEWFIPVPALDDLTWPLSWRCRPTTPDRFVHTLLLRTALHSEG